MSLQNREPVLGSWLEEVVQALRSLRYWQTQALGRVLAVFALASLVLAAIPSPTSPCAWA